MAKATKTAATKTAAAKTSKASKAKAPAAQAPALTPNQRKLLGVIAASKTPTTYKAMRQATGMKKGLSRAVGTPSKQASNPGTLLGRGLVQVVNASVPFSFVATPAGKAALK